MSDDERDTPRMDLFMVPDTAEDTHPPNNETESIRSITTTLPGVKPTFNTQPHDPYNPHTFRARFPALASIQHLSLDNPLPKLPPEQFAEAASERSAMFRGRSGVGNYKLSSIDKKALTEFVRQLDEVKEVMCRWVEVACPQDDTLRAAWYQTTQRELHPRQLWEAWRKVFEKVMMEQELRVVDSSVHEERTDNESSQRSRTTAGGIEHSVEPSVQPSSSTLKL